MKKLYILVVLGILVAPLAKADTLFLGDGGYNSNTGEKVIWCFSNECYDVKTGTKILSEPQVSEPQVKGTSVTTPAYTLLSMPNQAMPHILSGGMVDADLYHFTCRNNQAENYNTVYCANETNHDVSVQSFLFTVPVKYDGDYQSVTDNLNILDHRGVSLDFKPDKSNTSFYILGGLTYAKVQYPAPAYLIAGSTQNVLKIMNLNLYSTAVLGTTTGQDVVFKVN